MILNILKAKIELKPRNCQLSPYQPLAVPEFRIKDQFIVYTSPDSTYAVTRDRLRTARQSILIGIYDFTAGYIRDELLAALQRGVKISLMLDLDNLAGENELFKALTTAGVQGVPAPSCASPNAQYFPSSHEKVIVIDDEWTLVQSGNYTEASIPKNDVDGGDPQHFKKGNRDTGVAVHSVELAAFFTKVLRADMKLELDGEGVAGFALGVAPAPEALLKAPVPPNIPPLRFPSQTYKPSKALRVVPVLSPDNYMQVVPAFLKSAKKSILIEQQYIRGDQPQVQKLLAAIGEAWKRNPQLDVRVVLAIPIGGDLEKEKQSLGTLAMSGLKLGTNIRYLNKKFFTHCHDKLIIVDRKSALVSSQNWSDSAVAENREAGLILYSTPLAKYFTNIFQLDWDTGLQTLWPDQAEASFDFVAATEEMMAVSAGDYREV